MIKCELEGKTTSIIWARENYSELKGEVEPISLRFKKKRGGTIKIKGIKEPKFKPFKEGLKELKRKMK